MRGYFDIDTTEPEKCGSAEILQDESDAEKLRAALLDAENQKADLLRGIWAGERPELLLYRAITIIGTATNDSTFTDEAQKQLKDRYGDDLEAGKISERMHQSDIDTEKCLQTAQNALRKRIRDFQRIECDLYSLADELSKMQDDVDNSKTKSTKNKAKCTEST